MFISGTSIYFLLQKLDIESFHKTRLYHSKILVEEYATSQNFDPFNREETVW
jgi:predicted cupin superfamily sugar epimerase